MAIQLHKPLPQLLHETDTTVAHYQVWDTVYAGRPARVLYTGQRQTAQSGMAVDDRTDLLFDYNQRFYELIEGLQPRRVLLIGGGVYTLPTALCNDFPELILDVIEIDGQLDNLARQYFDFHDWPKLTIIHQDGRQFLETTDQTYDLVLIDAYMQADVPSSLQPSEIAPLLSRRLSPQGVVAYNLIAVYRGLRGHALRQEQEKLRAVFPSVSLHPAGHGQSLWLPQNLLLIGQLGQPHDLNGIVRYPSI